MKYRIEYGYAFLQLKISDCFRINEYSVNIFCGIQLLLLPHTI